MRITCIADLHGYYPDLPGGDLLIVAGDLTARDTHDEYCKFYDWIDHQNYLCKIFICGNHDSYIQKEDNEYLLDLIKSGYDRSIYLCDSGCEFEGLKIWDSPWTSKFPGINPKCCAFTCDTEDQLMNKFEKIPHDTDILITHSPAYSILDKTDRGEHVGSKYLYNWFKYVGRPKLHVFGHIHGAHGQKEVFPGYNDTMVKHINCSHVNERYRPVNLPITIDL